MKNISAAIETIREKLPQVVYRLDEPMRNHTSFRIGGPVSVMFFPKSQAELKALCRILYGLEARPLLLGNGTNILAEDCPIERIVLKTHGGLDDIRLTGETELTAECGALLSKLAVFALEHGLTGLEFATRYSRDAGRRCGEMNAGAYGGEMKNVVVRTTALMEWSSVCDVVGEDHGFSYRRSRFSDTGDVIVSSVLRLQPGAPEEIKRRMEELSSKRRASQPLTPAERRKRLQAPKIRLRGRADRAGGPQGLCRRRRHGIRQARGLHREPRQRVLLRFAGCVMDHVQGEGRTSVRRHAGAGG